MEIKKLLPSKGRKGVSRYHPNWLKKPGSTVRETAVW